MVKMTAIAGTYEMDPDGDVFVCLQDDTGATVTARCSSKVLSLASPVFKALLRPTFLEGSRLQQTGSTEIKLEDDDFGAMILILNVLHMQNQRVPAEPAQDFLFEIAVLVDKYDLCRALRPWHRLWLNKQRETVLVDNCDYEKWLYMAWVFRDSDIFKRTTRKLLLETKTNSDGAIITRFSHTLPIGLPSSITGKRWLLRPRLWRSC
jgi:hypothetical protein